MRARHGESPPWGSWGLPPTHLPSPSALVSGAASSSQTRADLRPCWKTVFMSPRWRGCPPLPRPMVLTSHLPMPGKGDGCICSMTGNVKPLTPLHHVTSQLQAVLSKPPALIRRHWSGQPASASGCSRKQGAGQEKEEYVRQQIERVTLSLKGT